MDELGLTRIELDNYITGLEINKAMLPDEWPEGDERVLQLMYRIKDILSRINIAEDDGEEG